LWLIVEATVEFRDKSYRADNSKRVYNKFTDIRKHNNYLLEHIGYMFRPVNRSSSGHQ